MKEVAGFWLPEAEQHLVPVLEASPRFFKGPTYQVDKLLHCLPFIRKFGLALDIGAHCGLWSRVMVRMFRDLHAFEPLGAHQRCFEENVEGAHLHPYGLADQRGLTMMRQGSDSTGDSHVSRKGDIQVRMETLDSEGLVGVDFIKIDCEGFEAFVLEGGQATIKRDRPCVILEQKPGMGQRFGLGETEAVDMLLGWGAVLRFQMSGDYCLSWDA